MQLEDNTNEIVDLLKDGKIWLHPTDTVWGLGCDALNESAINKIFEIKNRPKTSPLILLVADMQMLKEFVEEIHPKIETLLHYSTRPITVLYKSNGRIPKIITNQNNDIAIRIPQEPWLTNIIEQFGNPIVSTSANIHGEPFPMSFSNINPKIKENVDYIALHNRNIKIPAEPSVVITINEKDDIVFIRE